MTGVFLTVQAFLPHLDLSAAPKIAIISSQMGSSARAKGGSYIYRASKAAATNLGRNLAMDLAPRGIAVGIYHPGWVRTDMGGAGADISLEESVAGLMDRFDALSVATTGAFPDMGRAPASVLSAPAPLHPGRKTSGGRPQAGGAEPPARPAARAALPLARNQPLPYEPVRARQLWRPETMSILVMKIRRHLRRHAGPDPARRQARGPRGRQWP